MTELKPITGGDLEAALALAERCRATQESDAAESICLDVLDAEPENQGALVLLLLARTDLLALGLPRGVERAREVIPRLASEYDQAYYSGLICERQARYVLRQRGKRSGFVAYDWFRFAMDHYEEAGRLASDRPEPRLRHNACVRAVERHPHCQPTDDDRIEHAIE